MAVTADVLAPVKAVGHDVGADLFGGVGQSAGEGQSALNIEGLHRDLSVDLALIRADNVQLNVGLPPAAPGQPLLSVGVVGAVGVGSPTGGGSGLSPNIALDLGGSSIASANMGTQGQIAGVPVGIDAGGGVNTPPASPARPTLPVAPGAAQPAGGVNPQTAAPAGGTVSEAAAAPAPAITAPTAADGGGGALAADGPAAAPPATAVVRIADGGGDPAPLPPLTAGGGRVVETTLVPEGAGLATQFQPFDPGVPRALADLTARVAPSTGWLAALLARLRQWAPWLGGLAVAGAASVHEIRRRRRSVTEPRALSDA